jgi:hypothetical protein
MASTATAREPEWETLLPGRFRLVHSGMQLDVWQFSGVAGGWWYWSATHDGNYAGHGSQYETPDGACEAALEFANVTLSNGEDCIPLSGPS